MVNKVAQDFTLNALNAGKRRVIQQVKKKVRDLEIDCRLKGLGCQIGCAAGPEARPECRVDPRLVRFKAIHLARGGKAILTIWREDRRHTRKAAVTNRQIIRPTQHLEVANMRRKLLNG